MITSKVCNHHTRKYMSKVNIMSVCGSGVVTSSMVASKVKDMLEEEGYEVKVTETMPMAMENLVLGEHFDLIVYASPINDDFGIPALNAIGIITGLGVTKFKEDTLEILHAAGKFPG